HGVEDVAAGEVDGGRPVERERDARLVGGDQCVDDPVDVAAGQVVGLELVLVHLDAGLVGLDQRQDDLVRRHAPEAHGDEAGEAHLDAGGDRRDPQPDRDDREQDDEEEDYGAGQDDQGYVHQVSSRPLSAESSLAASPWASPPVALVVAGVASSTTRTVTRLPSTRRTLMRLPAGTESPSETTSTRAEPKRATPAGLRSERAVPTAPCRSGTSSAITLGPAGVARRVESRKADAKRLFGSIHRRTAISTPPNSAL